MSDAPLSPTKARIQRQVRAARRRRYALLLLLLGGSAAYAAKRWAEANRVFVVEVIRLARCDDQLRAPVSRELQPLLGQTFFEVAAHTEGIRKRLRRLPEVADASLTCRPPNVVEVSLTPRVPTLSMCSSAGWLSLDDTGVIVRCTPRPEAHLPQVFGVHPLVVQPGQRVGKRDLGAVTAVVAACRAVLGRAPGQLAVETGGGLRIRTAGGDLIELGQATDLEKKLRTWQVVRNRLPAAPAYIDVASPGNPVWQPPAAPPAAAPEPPAKP